MVKGLDRSAAAPRPRSESHVVSAEATAAKSARGEGAFSAPSNASSAAVAATPGSGSGARRALKGDKKSNASGGEDLSQVDLITLLNVMLRCTLSNSYLIRQLTGSIWLTYLSMAEQPLLAALLEVGPRYDAQVREAGVGHGLSSPHLHVFMRMIEFLKDALDVDPLRRGRLTWFWLHRIEPEEVAIEELGNYVLHMRARRCHVKKGEEKEQEAILSFAISALATFETDGQQWHLQECLETSLKDLAMTKKVGPPPRSDLERQLEGWLKRVKGGK